MKVNSRMYLKGLMVLFILITLVLLFPPYTIDNSRLYNHSTRFNKNEKNEKWSYKMNYDYKFFDFVFNSDVYIKRLDETYSYKVNSLEREVTAEDSIEAININTINIADTLKGFNGYNHLGYFIKYGILAEAYNDIAKKWKEKYPERNLDTVLNYTITKLTKAKYFIGYRKLLVSQLIIEILLSISVSGIVFVFLLLRATKNPSLK